MLFYVIKQGHKVEVKVEVRLGVEIFNNYSNYIFTRKYFVSCRDVVQLGGLVLGPPWKVPLRLRLKSLFTEKLP